MKIKLLLALALLSFLKIVAQTPVELENKYWNYRDRFKKYFTQIGEKPGQSIPAASIYTHSFESDTFKY